MPPFEIHWSAPEFEYREKDVAWYWVSIIIASLLIAFAAWERNFLFGVFVVIGEMLLVVWGNRSPRIVNFTLTQKGLLIESDKLHPMHTLESFGADDLDDAWTEIIFSFKAKLKTPIRIIVGKDTLEEIRKKLAPFVKEVAHEPSFIDSLEKIIRF